MTRSEDKQGGGSEEQGGGPRFESDFVPFDAEGPLPPGLRAAVVEKAFRHIGLKPKTVLNILKIRSSREPSATLLRRALDRAAHRDAVSRSERVAGGNKFLDVFGIYCTQAHGGSTGGVRVVQERATFLADKKMYADPEKLEASVSGERDYLADIGAIEPDSEHENIAILLLAFGMLQPEQVHELLSPVLRLAPAWREWFGVREVVGSDTPPVESEEPAKTAEVEEPPGETPTGEAAKEEGGPLPDASAAAVPALAEETQGARQRAFLSAASRLETARVRRRRLGGEEELDRDAFLVAADAESRAKDTVENQNQSLAGLAGDLVVSLRHTLSRHVVLADDVFGALSDLKGLDRVWISH